jgi:DNA-binding NarL/FixJ family response regulator
MAQPIRVLLVDDHAALRQALRTDLEAYPNIQVVGDAEDGEAALLSAIKLQPTAIVMDINMPKMDGVAATRLIKLQNPHIAVVGLSVDPKEYQTYAMEKAGAFKVLDKNRALTQLYETLQEAVAAVRPILVMEDSSLETPVIGNPEAKAESTD